MAKQQSAELALGRVLVVLCASVASPLSDARIARRARVERAEPLGCLWIGCRGVRCRGCVAVEGDALMVEDRALHGVARRPACAGPEPCRSFCAWSTSGPTHARWPESACVRQTSWSPVFLRWSGSSSFSGRSVRRLLRRMRIRARPSRRLRTFRVSVWHRTRRTSPFRSLSEAAFCRMRL